jgi:RHS repeat-associated protein
VYNYTYDNEGNLLTKTRLSDGQVTEYTWDYRNRLVRVVVKDAAGTVLHEERYTSDVLDRRIGVWEDVDGAGPQGPSQRWTVYDGDNPWADFDGAGSLITRYLYSPAIDQLFARISAAGEVDWYLTDHLGSVRQIVASDGTVRDAITYDSFGQVVRETNPSAGDRFKYTGREWHAALDQYYYRARYYDPGVGRFLGEDPLRFRAGDSNLYRYVGNSPTSAVDPTGLRPEAAIAIEALNAPPDHRKPLDWRNGPLGRDLPDCTENTSWSYFTLDDRGNEFWIDCNRGVITGRVLGTQNRKLFGKTWVNFGECPPSHRLGVNVWIIYTDPKDGTFSQIIWISVGVRNRKDQDTMQRLLGGAWNQDPNKYLANVNQILNNNSHLIANNGRAVVRWIWPQGPLGPSDLRGR